jgi:hypothetical protein
MTIALGIPHTPWVPERVKSVNRLAHALGFGWGESGVYYEQKNIHAFRPFTDREPNWSWSERLWRWGYETGAAHLLQLQDDVIVDGDFWSHLKRMLEVVPDQVIGLESVHNACAMLRDAGHHWYTTSDGLIGVGYVLPHAVLKEFLEWRATCLRPNAYTQVSEDTLIDMFCLSTHRRVYHPVVTIIDHDTGLSSTYGNDDHTHRRPALSTVRGDGPADWSSTMIPHLGRFYELTARACRRHVLGFHADDMIRALEDRGSQ